MSTDFRQFQTQVYEHTKQLFPDGAVDVLVAPAPGPSSNETPSPAVRLVHRATGLSVDCEEYPSQIQNRIIATLQLRTLVTQGILNPAPLMIRREKFWFNPALNRIAVRESVSNSYGRSRRCRLLWY